MRMSVGISEQDLSVQMFDNSDNSFFGMVFLITRERKGLYSRQNREEELQMYSAKLETQESGIRRIVSGKGCFSVLEFDRDVSTDPMAAMVNYFAAQMNVKKRQVIADLNNSGVIIQAGAMQMILGNVDVQTDVKGAGDFMKKFVGSKVTGETAIKPKYYGTGQIILEPTYKYILFEDLADWNGSIVIEDGLYLACDDTVEMKVIARSNLSSAVLGGEGLFNTSLRGTGIAVLESPVPREELIEVTLENDVVKIDGNQAIAWSQSLELTVEKTTKTFVGSLASGEGLVNVYRGSGKILIAPVRMNAQLAEAEGGNTGSMNGGKGGVGGAVGSAISGLIGN